LIGELEVREDGQIDVEPHELVPEEAEMLAVWPDEDDGRGEGADEVVRSPPALRTDGRTDGWTSSNATKKVSFSTLILEPFTLRMLSLMVNVQ